MSDCNHKFVQLSSCSLNRCIYCGEVTAENYNKVKEEIIKKYNESIRLLNEDPELYVKTYAEKWQEFYNKYQD